MRNRGKRLAAILGAAALVVCQNGVMEVRAEEVPASEEALPHFRITVRTGRGLYAVIY